ncbi:MAG: folate family ECF transporter S component [Lachnospiraceae bacterium]|nr:folate family ECF transporter S component [Lachnospiraceae bacterium]
MKKIRTLFTDSAREFRSIRTLALCGVFAAMAFLLESFNFPLGPTKVGFSGLPNEMVDVLFGPVVGAIFAGTLDIFKLLLRGDVWNPGLTLNAVLAGLIYGVCWYKKPIRLWRYLAAKLFVGIFINAFLGTYWLLSYFGSWAVLPGRLVKNLISAPVDALILYLVMTALNAAGVFKMIDVYLPKKKK